MQFQLHMLVNTDSGDLLKYPYIGIAEETDHYLHICDDHIGFLKGDDSEYNEKDYFPTSRSIELDAVLLASIIKKYIGPYPFELVTWLIDNPHVIIYFKPTLDGGSKSEYIYQNNPDPSAASLREQIFAMMRKVIDLVQSFD